MTNEVLQKTASDEQNVSSSNGLEPSIRFKNFTKKWNKISLKEIGTFQKGAPLSKADISQEGNPFILYGELYTTYSEVTYKVFRKTDKKVDKIYFSNVGDVILPTSGETPEEIAIATCIMIPDVILAGDLYIFRQNKIDGRILSYIINHTVNGKISRIAQGKSVVHVRSEELGKIIINYPTNDEQEKIANFLSLIDQRIEKQRQLVESLKKYKRGLLSVIFDKIYSNSTLTLGEICNITTGKLDANAMVVGGKYRFYTCAREYFEIDTYAFDTDALLISGNGANVGYIHHYCGKFNAYQRTYVLDRFQENIMYIYYYLQANLHPRIEAEKKAGNTPYIVLSTLSDMLIKLPTKEMQDKIAKIFAILDKKITTENDVLERLNTQKQGLLQQMFI